MLLIIAILLFLVFAGAGFVAHILWLGLILGVILLVVNGISNGRVDK